MLLFLAFMMAILIVGWYYLTPCNSKIKIGRNKNGVNN